MMDHLLCIVAGPVAGALLTIGGLAWWATRGVKWLVSGK